MKKISEQQNLILDLTAAARSKHLSSGLSIIDRLINRTNRVRYRLPSVKSVPRDFIRQEPWEIEYLWSVSKSARHGILETGRFNGGSSLIFACANSSVPIWSIDISPVDDSYFRELCNRLGVGENLELIVGDSQKTRYPQVGLFDVLFIDGDHSYQGCLNDLENWWPLLATGGHLLLHDCYLGNEVQAATIDFLSRQVVEMVQPPWRGSHHWRFPAGSLCHVIKRQS